MAAAAFGDRAFKEVVMAGEAMWVGSMAAGLVSLSGGESRTAQTQGEPSEDRVRRQPSRSQREASEETQPTGTLILDF